MRKLLYLILLIILFFSVSAQIRRSDIIGVAQNYASQEWEVIVSNDNYPIFSSEHIGDSIIGTAYSYGDKNTASSFLAEINDSLIPRNWEENYNDSTRLLYTGIDCSGLVTRALFFSDYLVNNTGASNLNKYTMKTEKSLPGDIYASSHHCFIQGEDSGWIYEANSLLLPEGGNRVQYYQKDPSVSYKKLTIFPIFSTNFGEFTMIEDSIEVLTVSGLIKFSEDLSVFGLVKNGIMVTPSISEKQKSISYSYSFYPDPGSFYQFICYAGNCVNGVTYYDSIINYIYYLPEIQEDYHIHDSIRENIPYPGFVFADKTIPVNINEGDKIVLAGDSLGVEDHWVDDIISLIILHSDLSISTWEHNYSIENEAVTPLPPIDLSEYFNNGLNYAHVILKDDPTFGVDFGCCNLWFVTQSLGRATTTMNNFPKIDMCSPAKSAFFDAEIYDIIGRKLLIGTYNSISQMRLDFESKINKSGVFFYKIQSGNGISSGKLCIMR